MSDLKYEIVKSLGVLSEGKDGAWKKEVNMVSWNDRKPKLDIREWDEDHGKMKKGVTFSAAEMKILKDILMDLDENSFEMEM